MYANKVDCIFIDPPYNTGNEGWCYNDNVNSPMMQAWLQANPVGIEDGLRHDKWCAMMWPRLRLLHELLTDTGSIWITLDHNEAFRARQMLDEIFGERNFLASMAWEKVYSPRMDAKGFSTDFDQVLVYAKNKPEVFLGTQVLEQNAKQFTYSEPETNRKARLRTLRKEGSESLRTDRENCWYPIDAPNGLKIWPIRPDGREGRWRWEESTFLKEKDKDPSKALFAQNSAGDWEVWVKQYYKGEADRPISTLMRHSEFGHTHEASEEIKEIFGDSVFDTPKPVRLISGILDLACPLDGLILDSFAGSGTTAHAVLAANKDDGGDRKFILVECEDYADKLTAERVRRVIKGYKFKGTQREELLRKSLNFTDLKRSDKLLDQIASIENLDAHRFDKIDKTVKNGELLVEGVKNIKAQKDGLGGSFTYCTLGDTIDIDRMLTGESLPSAEALGALLFHMATNEVKPVVKKAQSVGACSYLGESASFHVWLIYQPMLDFLTSREAALTLSLARALASAKPAKAGENAKRHLVFAPAKFVSQKLLDEENLPVEFAPLPWALYRIERT
jgi:adenine-specific DNA-methyltransferase